jgi:hypothetical protein
MNEETILPVLADENAEIFGHEVWEIAERLAQRLIEQNKRGGIKASLRVEAREADGTLVGVVERDALTCINFAKLCQQNLLAGLGGAAQNLTDTGGTTTRSVAVNSAVTAPLINAGTTGTAAAFADTKLGTETETVAATVNALSSNTFTVTGTITAGSARSYQEVGIRVTCATFLFQICHDTFSALSVSSGGTLAVTYTFSFT